MTRLQHRPDILRQIEGVQTKLERLTIFSCGAPVLQDHINIGTEYIVFPGTEVDDGYYRCARCGIEQRDIRLIDAIPVSSPNASPIPLPRDLFPARLETEDTVSGR
jgi:hypothetical protein